MNRWTFEEDLEEIAGRIDTKNYAGKSVLVTGATGMLGSYYLNILTGLLDLQGYKPASITATSKSGDFNNLKDNVSKSVIRHHTGFLTATNTKTQFDIIFHAASPASPRNYSDITSIKDANLQPIEFLEKTQKNLQQIIYISAGETYGTSINRPEESGVHDFLGIPEGRQNYPKIKLLSEGKIKELGVKSGAKTTIIKLFHTFGPGVRKNDGRSFADFLWAVAEDRKPIVKSSGSSIRSFLYLADTVAGIVLANDLLEGITTIRIGSNRLVSIRDFAQMVCEVSGSNLRPIFTDQESGIESSPHDLISPETSDLRQLGWEERISLESAIDKTMRWMRQKNLS
jgi:nucleoside-diphosphate-sugar epimerase